VSEYGLYNKDIVIIITVLWYWILILLGVGRTLSHPLTYKGENLAFY